MPSTRVVVRRARRLHRPQRVAVDAGREQPRADQPVGLRRRVWPSVHCLTSEPNTSEMLLVERAGLRRVFEAGRVLGDAVRQLVADDVERPGEAVEQLAVAVAEDHLLRRPRTRCRTRSP